MIIDSATVKLSSQFSSSQFSQQSESFRQSLDSNESRENPLDQIQISQEGQRLANISNQATVFESNDSTDILDDLNVQIIKRLFENITGHKFKLFSAEHLEAKTSSIQSISAQNLGNTDGVIYEKSSVYYESESFSFSALGQITTTDGKNIDFSVKLNMTREFYQQSHERFQIGVSKKIDPLVVNFNGTAAELSSTKFEFDLDNNGSTEQIAQLNANSGFLVLDKNNDGYINNGSELFGPQTGNGFQELAKHDEDRNGFIDETDSIYSQLRIWQHLGGGRQKLVSLGDKDIGAIYLGHVSTPFQLKDNSNQSLGEIASTGIFIKESGESGIIQHINLSV